MTALKQRLKFGSIAVIASFLFVLSVAKLMSVYSATLLPLVYKLSLVNAKRLCHIGAIETGKM